jgi:hypothetical protein
MDSCLEAGLVTFEAGKSCTNDLWPSSLVNMGLPVMPAGVYSGS